MSASPLDDGRWVLVTVGTSRFRLVSWVTEEPYPQAEVTPLAERGEEDRVRAALPTAEAAVRRALALGYELAEPGGAPPDFTLAAEAAVAAWQLATLAPVSPMDQLRLLAEDDHVARLRLTTELAADAASVLAYRLSGG
jgi:Lon protease-like protein